ncbi:MAG: hypothetical protein RRC07_17320 [Anaerolineae bacterium]|nr:hypothetical protein [Anaerolineae bacterium]
MAKLQLLAGSLSTLIFVTSSLPMLYKALRTRDLSSYSLANIGLANAGNFLYWLYVLALPFGPIWFLHAFNTVVALLMLLLYLRHETSLPRSGPFTNPLQRDRRTYDRP